MPLEFGESPLVSTRKSENQPKPPQILTEAAVNSLNLAMGSGHPVPLGRFFDVWRSDAVTGRGRSCFEATPCWFKGNQKENPEFVGKSKPQVQRALSSFPVRRGR